MRIQSKEQTSSAFDRWAKWWNWARPVNEAVYQAVISRLTGEHLRVLDVACGTGLLGRLLCDAEPGRSVTGVDLSPAMIEQARRLSAGYDPSRLRFEQADAENLAFPNGSFDAVVNTLSLHHFPNPGVALAQFRRLTREGGRVIIVDVATPVWFARTYTGINRVWARWTGQEWLRTPEEVADMLAAAGLRVTEVAPVRYFLPTRVFVSTPSE